MFPTFANPEWLWCLLLLPPLAGLRVWSHLRSKAGASGLVSPKLTKDLIIGARQWSRWVVFSLQLIALASLLLALARPQWGFEVTDEESESRNVVIAIDTSRSMLANDLTPDRLTRAKLAAQDIVMSLPEDRIALIAFAGKAFLQAPLTLDHDAVLESIQQFDSELIPRGGSNLTKAAELAIELLEKVDSQESALIIFSDGEALEGKDDLKSIVDDAEKVGLNVITIGVGTENGSIIPEPDDKGKPQPGTFVTDDEGNVVRSRLDPAALREMSHTLGGGAYLDLAATSSVAKSVNDTLKRVEVTRGASQSRRRPIDRFMWPLGIAMFFFVAAWLLPGTSRWIERLVSAARNSSPRSPTPASSG
ncbi:MAG: VWA domain-containing protein, partial [Verrucomicrobiae bacterium]|nr:VWA domain-containing protein [Verrucomicrobiae bacterium]